jgi:hypothetical protein
MDYQARIPAALAAIHNFIHIHDPDEIEGFAEADDVEQGFFCRRASKRTD